MTFDYLTTRIGDVLVNNDIATRPDVEAAFAAQSAARASIIAAGGNANQTPRIGEILVERGTVNRETMDAVLIAQSSAQALRILDAARDGRPVGQAPFPPVSTDSPQLVEAQTLAGTAHQTAERISRGELTNEAARELRGRAYSALSAAAGTLSEQGHSTLASRIALDVSTGREANGISSQQREEEPAHPGLNGLPPARGAGRQM